MYDIGTVIKSAAPKDAKANKTFTQRISMAVTKYVVKREANRSFVNEKLFLSAVPTPTLSQTRAGTALLNTVSFTACETTNNATENMSAIKAAIMDEEMILSKIKNAK